MKSVMFSEIVQAPRHAALRGLTPLTAYGLTLAVGTPLLVLALRAAFPDAPLAIIVLPVLAGIALPLCASAPGRLDISTRFDACHMRATLGSALGEMGFIETSAGPERIRYVKAGAGPWRAQAVSVRIRTHALEVTGPIPTLRTLQAALAGTAASNPVPVPAPAARRSDLSNRETVAAAMQISDNAERVAGMAE
ncbi:MULTISPECIES: hypothetical protein [unclassified Massilia]|uniref:hypothetical protein n=1 Tax=unclassified Massilia TaxID=2609279 RepID=UPI00177B5D5F|nr:MULTISPECIES: hypothetical protein [unclassified Massilia]MBD8532874.1 hypothetical protein [Massilia sp. CFBP 13647]MBD8676235.1 hypothetical protein [Massilia sp. CFBP 13721]